MISYHKAKLEHFGKWVDLTEGENGEKLQAMHGEAKLWNIGSQLEFHFIDINDFGSRRDLTLKWSPYLSLGFMVNLYDPTVETRYGDGDWENNYDLLFPKWASSQATRDTKGITGSLTAGIGTRKKLGEYSDVFIESRWQYFFSNWVDGLNARDDVANKFNDWLLYFHVGYVYYLN